jgi:hypothetical protein
VVFDCTVEVDEGGRLYAVARVGKKPMDPANN